MELEKFHFYLLRLKNSSLYELIYRVKRFLFVLKLKILYSKKKNLTAIPKIDYSRIQNLQLPAICGDTDERLVKKILNDYLFALNTELNAIKRYENRWRNTYFNDIRTTGQDIDLRSVWEPARLQHIAILINYIIQNEKPEFSDRVLKFSKNEVLKWINENPFLCGPHYISAMECGLRIPLFFFCLKILDNLNPGELQLILDTLYRHAWWISNRLSLYSSRGNHTVAEASGLIFGGAVFRDTIEGRQWLAKGYELLKNELDHQILIDGGSAEQSLDYHRFVLDLYWLAIDFLKKNNFYDCDVFEKRLIEAEHFIAAFKDFRGQLPSIGDSDGGHAIGPGIYPCRTHLNTKNLKIQTFSKSGYTIFNDKNVVLTFDHGPLGMAPLYNHGHADALSITLSVNGQEILVDPGTYRYNGEPEFRKYFKSTRAHNTITIDGQDQAIQETDFIWSHAYNAELVQKENLNGVWLIQAGHDGYMRNKRPVQHIRSLFIFDGTAIIIRDKFFGEGTHEFELNFHLHPDLNVSKCHDSWWNIHNHRAEIYMTVLNQNDFRVIKGEKSPILGWFSPSYGLKCGTSVLNISITGIPEESTLTTGIGIDRHFDLRDIKARLDEIE
jgi:hypothetical protein